MFLGNPENSVWEDWGTLRNIRDDYGNHHPGTLKNPIMNRATATKPTNDIPIKLPSLVHKDPLLRVFDLCKTGDCTLPETNSKFAPENRPGPKRKFICFRGELLVSGRVAL